MGSASTGRVACMGRRPARFAQIGGAWVVGTRKHCTISGVYGAAAPEAAVASYTALACQGRVSARRAWP